MSDFTNVGSEIGGFLGPIINGVAGSNTTTQTTTTEKPSSNTTIIIVVVIVLVIGVAAWLYKKQKTS